jgi:hypothetical protein
MLSPRIHGIGGTGFRREREKRPGNQLPDRDRHAVHLRRVLRLRQLAALDAGVVVVFR